MATSQRRQEAAQFRARHSAMLDAQQFKIWYFVPHLHADPHQATMLMGFPKGIIDTWFLFRGIPFFPSDVRELYAQRDNILPWRITGSLTYKIAPIQIEYLSDAYHLIEPLFCCIISTPETAEAVDDVVRSAALPVM